MKLWNSPTGSVQFSLSVVSNSLWPHESQHARPPCPSPTPRVYSNSRPSSRWCHPAISSSVVPFSSCPQSLPASGSFPMSQLFAWGGQSIGVSALASVLPTNTQDWSPLEWIGWISLQSKGLSMNTNLGVHGSSELHTEIKDGNLVVFYTSHFILNKYFWHLSVPIIILSSSSVMEKAEIPSQGAWILAEERQTQHTTVQQEKSCREADESCRHDPWGTEESPQKNQPQPHSWRLIQV